MILGIKLGKYPVSIGLEYITSARVSIIPLKNSSGGVLILRNSLFNGFSRKLTYYMYSVTFDLGLPTFQLTILHQAKKGLLRLAEIKTKLSTVLHPDI